MPKKMGVNSKAEEARSRKAAALTEKQQQELKMKQDTFWKEAEGPKSKAAKKKEEDAERRAEAALKRAESKRLEVLEQQQLDQYSKRVDKKAIRVGVPVPKVTAAELAKFKEAEQEQLQTSLQKAKKRESRTADEEEYERLITVENTNRDDSLVDAHSVNTALAQIVVANDTTPDRHPERRLKASYKRFEEAELPQLKLEKPGLTHTQYKDMLWKIWKKSPDNPLNQPASAKKE